MVQGLVTILLIDQRTLLLRKSCYGNVSAVTIITKVNRCSTAPGCNFDRRVLDLTEITAEYKERIARLHRVLGIPADYNTTCRLPLYPEPSELVETEPDYYQRPQRLTPQANQSWLAMQQAAANEGVILYLISAYRSVDYQFQLIQRQLQEGRELEELLTMIAAPGHREHHTGRASDISTENCRALELEFANTHAYAWLRANAGEFSFELSFPEDNPYGIKYEPWHWCHRV